MKSSTLFAFLGGAVAGAAVAMLIAPQKGEETRRQIKEFVEHEMHKCKCKHHDHDHGSEVPQASEK